LRQTAGVARHLLWLLPIVALAACGSRAGGAGAPSSPALPPTVSAPATLLPDGTVPWVDEPAGEREFSLPPPARRVDPNAKPCLAGDLRGELTQWTAPGNSGEPGVPQREPPKLIGYARVANTGQQTCRLHGEVDTRLRDRTGELKIGYSRNVNDEAEQRVTIVPPGESADLRLDWSAPFCAPHDGSLELEITLPENGGKLRAPITATSVPPCGRPSETHPEITSFLASSVFDEPSRETAMDSPLAALTATIEPVPTAKPGDLVTFHVRLTNPTAAAIPLDPGPGYLQERFSQGTAELRAINDSGLYRLNCRPVRSIPAHGTIRFAMGVHIPTELTADRALTVTWRLTAPKLASGPWANLTLTAA
jgi:hypothetical protein